MTSSSAAEAESITAPWVARTAAAERLSSLLASPNARDLVEPRDAVRQPRGPRDSTPRVNELLITATIVWVTGTINSANRSYYVSRHDPHPMWLPPGERIEAPAGIAIFPGEADLVVPREIAQR